MIIQDLFLYFAKFPDHRGVKAIATMGGSELSEYDVLLTALDMMPEHSLVPGIDHYVYGQTLEDLQQRIDKLSGSWLMADYGELTSRADRGSMEVSQRVAVTVAMKLRSNADMMERMIASDRSLQLLSQVHARMMADAECGRLDWMHRDAVLQGEIIPFVASELSSYGWTLMVDAAAPDMLGTRQQAKELMKIKN